MLRVGNILRGARATYELQQALKGTTVFKARIVNPISLDEKWAIVKTCSTSGEQLSLLREYQHYQIPNIAASPYIRQMYEAIGSFEDPGSNSKMTADNQPCLVLEWLDHCLWNIKSDKFRSDPALIPKLVARSVLSALATFRQLGKVHTDINPNNILLSSTVTSGGLIKICDLGVMMDEGYTKHRLQSLPCRAPEVWKGQGVSHASEVWSVGVTLAHWLLGRAIFGADDKIIVGHTEAWCIAKIQRLVGQFDVYTGQEEIEEEFDVAANLFDMELDKAHGNLQGKLINADSLRQELERIESPPIAPELIDFIESLLVLDETKRPTAEEALRHPFLT
ncbi:hypothetical protein M0657_009907 [Pyricularia oryzae]|uniref:Protein kinase domain-containing protein n=2 Tax=Pyricularia TaxID=48558 RepID=A0A6P8BGS5_PYRGI|nr:uncharacterized protein PgNI_01063 [Pyricularia grisea]ELQ32385.1 hypothetical protein OOU_Y34scaffold01172g1 [Pyricularia oryzae Y34]KAI7913679.1 hypothetical protein M0657_009907 [Pyricularia oryzae]TLD15819.1 hypothetical protein PgNI_01063 [Pyricularia grisea]